MDDLDVVLSSEDGLSPEEVEEICEAINEASYYEAKYRKINDKKEKDF